jgi:hypothetical protein
MTSQISFTYSPMSQRTYGIDQYSKS